MWNVQTKVIPVIIEVTGTISKSFRKYLGNIQGKHNIKELPKKRAVTLDTAHIPRKVLLYMYKTFNMKNNISCSINCKYRIDEKLYTLDTWFVSGM